MSTSRSVWITPFWLPTSQPRARKKASKKLARSVCSFSRVLAVELGDEAGELGLRGFESA